MLNLDTETNSVTAPVIVIDWGRDDFFDDPVRVNRYAVETYRFRRKVLGMSKEDALEWTTQTVEEYRAIVEGRFVDAPALPPVPMQFTIAVLPMTDDEEKYFAERVKFRIEVCKCTYEEAVEWTVSDIEGARVFDSIQETHVV